MNELCNPSVTGGNSLWTKVRRKGKGPPWPGGPGGPLGTMRRWFLRGWGGGRGLPPPLAEAQSVHRGYGPPGRCFRRVPPEPPGHSKACTPPLFTEGLHELSSENLHFAIYNLHFAMKFRVPFQNAKLIPALLSTQRRKTVSK